MLMNGTAPGSADSVYELLYRLDARERLKDLALRYCMACDSRDLDALANLYTPDAVFQHEGGSDRAVGVAEIVDLYDCSWKKRGPSTHIPYAHSIDFQDYDHASGIVHIIAEVTLADQAMILALRYEDEYRHLDGKWKFASRLARVWYVRPVGYLLGHGGQTVEDRELWSRFYHPATGNE